MTFHGFSCLNLLAEHAFDFYEGKCKVAFYLLSSTLDSPFAEGTIGCGLGDNSYFVVVVDRLSAQPIIGLIGMADHR